MRVTTEGSKQAVVRSERINVISSRLLAICGSSLENPLLRRCGAQRRGGWGSLSLNPPEVPLEGTLFPSNVAPQRGMQYSPEIDPNRLCWAKMGRRSLQLEARRSNKEPDFRGLVPDQKQWSSGIVTRDCKYRIRAVITL